VNSHPETLKPVMIGIRAIDPAVKPKSSYLKEPGANFKKRLKDLIFI